MPRSSRALAIVVAALASTASALTHHRGSAAARPASLSRRDIAPFVAAAALLPTRARAADAPVADLAAP